MPTPTVERAVIDPAAALAAARAELRNGVPSLHVLNQLTRITETLLSQVDSLAAQLTEARTCPVTQLPTRAAWTALAEEICATGPTAVLILDLNAFKPVNDTYGHAAGDAVLAAVGERLKGWTDGRGHAGRLGGDEFVLAVRDEPGLDQAVEDLRKRLTAPVPYGPICLSVGASLGAARVSGRTPEALSNALSEADHRMYHEKGQPGRR